MRFWFLHSRFILQTPGSRQWRLWSGVLFPPEPECFANFFPDVVFQMFWLFELPSFSCVWSHPRHFSYSFGVVLIFSTRTSGIFYGLWYPAVETGGPYSALI